MVKVKILQIITKDVSDNEESKLNLIELDKNLSLNEYTTIDKKLLNIVCFGDSITWGQSSYEPSRSYNPWPDVLGDILNSRVDNFSIPGSTLTKRNINDFDCLVERVQKINLKKYDRCYISFGTNDLSYKIPLGKIDSKNIYEFYGSMNFCVDYVKKNNPTIDIIFIVPMMDSRLDYTYSNAIINFCNMNKIAAIDLRNIGVGSKDLYSIYWDKSSLMHPNEIMYGVIGKYIALWPNYTNNTCYKIQYDSKGGYLDLNCSFGVRGFSVGKLPVTLKSGCEFIGWYHMHNNKEYEISSSSNIPEEWGNIINVYAKYKDF